LGAKNGIFGALSARKMGRERERERERAKYEIWGWGRGRKEMLVDKPLDFENLRSPANGTRDWLG